MGELAQLALQEVVNEPLQDVGGGRWRSLVGKSAAVACAVAPFLEQAKLLARGSGNAKALLKFAGFALWPASTGEAMTIAEAQFRRLEHLAQMGWTVAPTVMAHGWIGLPWIEGPRLDAAHLCTRRLRRLGRYIRDAAGPPMGSVQTEHAFGRLRHMLVCNARELLGELAGQCAARASDAVMRSVTTQDLPSYGDGRMAPHEWVRSGMTMLKVDAAGHQHDHTVIGGQPLWWDVAGATVEWSLSADERSELARLAGVVDSTETAYFRAAYAAYRAGIAKLWSEHSGGPTNENDCIRAMRYYRNRLAAELASLDWLGPSRAL